MRYPLLVNLLSAQTGAYLILHPPGYCQALRHVGGGSGALKEELAERGVLLVTERAERKSAERQHVEVWFAALKRTFGLGETLASTSWVWRPELRPSSPPTPTAATSTASWVVPKGELRSCGPEILATLI